MRTKEEAHDYRYFPEPDLPPLVLDEAWIDAIRQTSARAAEARRRRLVAQYRVPDYDAGVLTQSMALADYFERDGRGRGQRRRPRATGSWASSRAS